MSRNFHQQSSISSSHFVVTIAVITITTITIAIITTTTITVSVM